MGAVLMCTKELDAFGGRGVLYQKIKNQIGMKNSWCGIFSPAIFLDTIIE